MVAKLQDTPESLTIDMQPGCFRMVRESTLNTDLTGNTLIAAGVRTEVPPRGKIQCGPISPAAQQDDSGARAYLPIDASPSFRAAQPASAASFAHAVVRTYPTRPLYARVSVDFVLRRIDRGAESYEEGTQDVTLLKGTTSPDCQVILRTDELMPPTYILASGSMIVSQNNGPPLVFTDPEVARGFGDWLRRMQARTFGGITLETGEPSRLQAIRYAPPEIDPCSELAYNVASRP